MKPESSLWVQTATGMAVDLLTPRPEQIRATDIAVSLARMARFNGQTRLDGIGGVIGYSVARHSLLAESLLPPDTSYGVRLAVLLHDAPEAYTGDIVSPMKWAIEHILLSEGIECDPIGVISDDLHFAIMRALGLDRVDLPPDLTAIVKHCDIEALAIEKRDLMAPHPRPWGHLPDVMHRHHVWPRQPLQDSREFLTRLRTLTGDAGVPVMPTFWDRGPTC